MWPAAVRISELVLRACPARRRRGLDPLHQALLECLLDALRIRGSSTAGADLFFSLHNNGTKDVTFGSGGTYPNTMGGGTANSMSLVFGGSNPVANIITSGSNVTCSNLMCHYATTPNWY